MKKIINYLLVVFCFFCIHHTSDAQYGVVKGKISDNTGVLPGATISIGNKIMLSDLKGEFVLNIKPGKFIITITHAGYLKIENDITVTEGSVQFFDFILQPSNEAEGVIVVGSRSSIQRSNLNTAVPVDVIQLSKLPQRQTELTRIINNSIPSFNAAPHGFAAGRHMLPASLRGLGPDQTLVLLNERRLHNIAAPWTFGVTGFGTVGIDLNAVPSGAIETVEVLRDGASAQYGSDAIAGIINLRLKRTTGITSIQVHTGQYYKGDGEAFSFNINKGFALHEKGFINITAHFRFNDYTQRNGEYTGTVYNNIRTADDSLVKANGFDRMNHRPLGDNRVYNTGIAINGGYNISKRINLFWTTIWNYRFVRDISSNQYRYPKDSSRIIKVLYPNGFLPYMESKIPDVSFIGGVEGETLSGWRWDAGITYGKNASTIEVFNTNNASQYLQGLNAQSRFYTGKQIFSQSIGSLNFKRELSQFLPNVRSFTVALGGEFRIDQYKIKEGEMASWENYARNSGKESGSQGQSGFRPENVVNKNRKVVGAYAELDMETKRTLWSFAERYEHYSDFGSNVAGKLAMRYKFSKQVSWRASVSNGFRAPSLQQRFYSLVTTVSRPTGIFRTGTFRNDSEIAKAFGIGSLTAEKAINVSTGFASTVSKNITLTIDAYWIQIKNRVLYTGTIPGNLPEVRRILDSFGFKDVQSVRFFSNAINTRTKGLDVVLNGRWFIKRSLLEASLAANFSRTIIFGTIQSAKNLPDNDQYRTLLVNREERCRIEDAYPRDKIILNITYTTGKWKLNTSHFRYGSVSQKNNNPVDNPDQTFSPKIVSSLSVGYKIKSEISLIAGAENIFNVYPDKLKYAANTQSGLLIYNPNFTVFGCNGGYYFINMSFNFLSNKKSHH